MIRALGPNFAQLSVQRMCSLLRLSRARVYQPAREVDRSELLRAIESIVLVFLGYGYRRVHRELARRGIEASAYEVRVQMREHGLLARRPRSRGITGRNSEHRRFWNLMRQLEPTAPDQVWVADLTQIRTASGAVYMAGLLDLYSRKVIAWRLSRNPDVKLALACLEQALQTRGPAPGWLHHSDQGSTYTAGEYVSKVRAAGGRVSMSRTGTPTLSAVMESFFRTLKVEEVRPNQYSTFLEAQSSLDLYVRLYNEQRMHSSLGYLSPDQYEAHTAQQGP